MAVLNTTSPVVLPAAPMEWPLKMLPSARASTAGAVTSCLSFRCPNFRPRGLQGSLCDAQMHKAGGVLLEHPPALCGLTRYSDYGQKCKDPHRPCPRPRGNFAAANWGAGRAVEHLKLPRERSYPPILFRENISHLIPARRLPGQPLPRHEGTARKHRAVTDAVAQHESLALAQEQHLVLADHIATPQRCKTDLTAAARVGGAVAGIDRLTLELAPAALRGRLAQGQRGAGGRIGLMAVVHLENLDVIAALQGARGGAHQAE